MPRGTSPSDRGQINKKRKTDYLNSQLSKLQSKLKNTTDTKSRQRLKQSISSVKKQLDTSPKSYIKSKFEKVNTSRGLKVRPKKTEKTTTIKKVKYPVYKGKVEEKKVDKPTNGETTKNSGTTNNSETKKETPKYKKVTQKELDAKIAERKKPKEKLKVKPKKMHAIEKRNRERFGDAHVDKLKKQYAEFRAKRKKKKKK